MEKQHNVKVIGTLEDKKKSSVAQELIDVLLNKYPQIDGEIYLGYPIYVDEIANRRVCVDMIA